MKKNTVTQESVEAIIGASVIEFRKFGGKTLVCSAELPNGFVLVVDASCVDPANYDEEVGKEICLNRLADKIWELEGYALQDFLHKASEALSNSK